MSSCVDLLGDGRVDLAGDVEEADCLGVRRWIMARQGRLLVASRSRMLAEHRGRAGGIVDLLGVDDDRAAGTDRASSSPLRSKIAPRWAGSARVRVHCCGADAAQVVAAAPLQQRDLASTRPNTTRIPTSVAISRRRGPAGAEAWARGGLVVVIVRRTRCRRSAGLPRRASAAPPRPRAGVDGHAPHRAKRRRRAFERSRTRRQHRVVDARAARRAVGATRAGGRTRATGRVARDRSPARVIGRREGSASGLSASAPSVPPGCVRASAVAPRLLDHAVGLGSADASHLVEGVTLGRACRRLESIVPSWRAPGRASHGSTARKSDAGAGTCRARALRCQAGRRAQLGALLAQHVEHAVGAHHLALEAVDLELAFGQAGVQHDRRQHQDPDHHDGEGRRVRGEAPAGHDAQHRTHLEHVVGTGRRREREALGRPARRPRKRPGGLPRQAGRSAGGAARRSAASAVRSLARRFASMRVQSRQCTSEPKIVPDGSLARRLARSLVTRAGHAGTSSFSTTRRRADRARRLAWASASVGVRGARTRRTSARAPQTHGSPGGQSHTPRATSEAVLDDAVLARVVGQHGDAAARPSGVDARCRWRRAARRSSSLTSMRMAWKVRLAGCPPCGGPAPGWRRATTAASSVVVWIGRAATMAGRSGRRSARRRSGG